MSSINAIVMYAVYNEEQRLYLTGFNSVNGKPTFGGAPLKLYPSTLLAKSALKNCHARGHDGFETIRLYVHRLPSEPTPYDDDYTPSNEPAKLWIKDLEDL